MSDDLLRAAVVGVGYLGRFHAQKYQKVEGAKLVAVCDARSEQVCTVAQELEVEAVHDYKGLVGKIDIVTIASTTSTHYELAHFFLENNIHVHVEKPMTTTIEQGRELCGLAEKKNLKLQVGHVERFNPALISAQEKFKNPFFIESHRLAPFKPRGVDVSVILDLMIHDIDVILSLVKSPVKNIQAVGTAVLTKTEDIANARIEFETGCVANLTCSRVSQKAQRKFRMFQPNQYLSLDFGSGEVNLLTKTGEIQGEDIPLEMESWSLEKGDALLAETQSFVDCVRENKSPVVSGRDGLIALEVAEKIISIIRQSSQNSQSQS